MAAHGRHIGHCLQKNGQFLVNNIDKLCFRRGFYWSPVLHQQTTEATTASTESIVLPKKKTWSKVAVLEALASTVKRDPTTCHYQFQDDSFLNPRSSAEFTLYRLSMESGRAAAKYFIDNHPKFFTKDFAEPHIPCLMPESITLSLEEVSEEALKERLKLRRVTAAVDMYDQMLQSGLTVSMETTHDLLDLISFYCDRDPVEEAKPEEEEADEEGEETKPRRRRFLNTVASVKPPWKTNNNAERIFNLLPERDTRCYSALIRGMVKHGAHARAFTFYGDMLNNRVNGDVHIFNALILAAGDFKEQWAERWDLVVELLNQMNQQKVCPTLETFNNALQVLRRCGFLSRTHAPQILSEMKALGIAPSLATYDSVIHIFSRSGGSDILHEVMSEIEGTSFTCRDLRDVYFFATAMKICFLNKDLELGYKVQSLLEFGENWKLLGDSYQQNTYYGRFFDLLCMMEPVDVVLKWYRNLIPSAFFPNTNTLRYLVQALDTDQRLDLLPMIWKDIRGWGHDRASDLAEDLFGLMSREKHSPELQQQFAECALEFKEALLRERRMKILEGSRALFNHITTLLLRGDKTQQHAWEMLEVFKSNNRIPSLELMEEFLSWCISSGSCDKAVELVKTSASFCLPGISQLAERAMKELPLSDEQRSTLSELVSAAEPSD